MKIYQEFYQEWDRLAAAAPKRGRFSVYVDSQYEDALELDDVERSGFWCASWEDAVAAAKHLSSLSDIPVRAEEWERRLLYSSHFQQGEFDGDCFW